MEKCLIQRPRLVTAILAIGCAAQIACIFSVEFPPLQDYPNHLLRAHITRSYERVPVYQHYIVVEGGFRPNLLAEWYLDLLVHRIPVTVAGKLVLSTQVVLAGVAVWFYLRAFGGNVLSALIAAQVIGSWFFLKGNLNFHIGVSVGLFLLTLAYSRQRDFTAWRALAATLVSLVLVCAHGFVLLAFAGMAGVASIVTAGWASPRGWLRAAVVLPAVVVFVSFVVSVGESTGLNENRLVYASSVLDLVLFNPLLVWQRFRPWLDTVAALLSYIVLLLGFATAVFRASRWHATELRSRNLTAVLVFATVAAILYLIAPDRLSGGWGHMKFRLAHIWIMVSLPLAGAIAWRTLRLTAAGLLAVVCLTSATLTVIDYRRLDREAAGIVRMADEIPRGSLVLPMDAGRPDQPLRPFLHLWSYVCIRRDCLSPYLFSERYARNIGFRRPLVAPVEGAAGWQWDALEKALNEERYAAVLLRGRAPFLEERLEQRMRLAGKTDGASLFLRDVAGGGADH